MKPESPRTLTAAELDAMSPNERAQALRDRIVTDPSALPSEFRERVEQAARDLGTEANRTS